MQASIPERPNSSSRPPRYAIDTRRVSAGLCADGHETETFDLIIDGRLYESAAVIHQRGAGLDRDIYFEPSTFREWLEADHDLLHAVAEALIGARVVPR